MKDTPDRADASLAVSLADLVLTLAKQNDALLDDTLKAFDLTHTLAYALWALDPDAPAPSMRQVAGTLGCDPSSVTFLADRLTERGLVEVRVKPTDRRVKVLALTSGGAEVRRKLLDAVANHSPLARLSAGEQEQLHGLLAKAVTPSP